MDKPDLTMHDEGKHLKVRFNLPVSALRAAADDGVMLLRFGAAVNALNAMVGLFVDRMPALDQDDFSTARDRLQVYLCAAAYLREATKLFDEYAERPWALVRLATTRGYLKETSFNSGKALLSPDEVTPRLMRKPFGRRSSRLEYINVEPDAVWGFYRAAG